MIKPLVKKRRLNGIFHKTSRGVFLLQCLFYFSLATGMNYDTSNEMFGLAAELVKQGSCNVFLTGKAGTGKTTFLKYIRENCAKQMAVVAPTGVAAINAGGVTIHSFFQLPLSPFIPEAKGFKERNDDTVNPHSLISRLRMNNDKKRMLQELELLIIDEISMVRCDILDEIDLVLRHVRNRYKEHFGGVQLLFVGDMFQLPPVIKENEWRLLSPYYSSPFFFDSKVMKEAPPVYIEFTKIYRQSEEQFINLLNQVRNNELDQGGNELLQSLYQPGINRRDHKDHIVLTTHNEKAGNINTSELAKLEGKAFIYKSEIEGDFPLTACPADELLQLKVGAKVMFIKNDTDKSRRYFNGKIGVISELEEDKIFVQCEDDPSGIEVKKEKWENIRYALNKSTHHLEEEVLGSFTQYPLRLAWAITIHKSQGLTFEKAIIDAGEAFAAGQVYVALSRCTNLEGMILHSRIRPHSLSTDKKIIEFSKGCSTAERLKRELEMARSKYQLEILLSIFDFNRIFIEAKETQEYILQHASSFNSEAFLWVEELLNKVGVVKKTAEKFQAQVKLLFLQNVKPGENSLLSDRLIAAEIYFLNELKTISEFLKQSPVVTDSRLHAKEYNESIKDIFIQLSLKKFLLEGSGGKLDVEAFHRRKKAFVSPQFSVNAYAGVSQQKTDNPYPDLYQRLKKLRDSICLKKDIPVYIVAGSKTLDEMATYLPQSIDELEQISGFGKAKLETYGKQFLEIVQQYCKEHNLLSRISDKIPKRKRKESSGIKTDTKAETFQRYKNGKTVAEISKERNLTTQTIEGHLSYYVQTGEIKIEELVSREKFLLIEPVIKGFHEGTLTSIKEKLGESVSYGEIRLVLAWQQFQKNLSSHIHH